MKLALAMVLIAAAACAPRTAAPTATPISTPTSTVAAATTTPATTNVASTNAPSVAAGAVTGYVGYPAEGHPALRIYAVSTSDRTVFFSVDVPQGTDPKPVYSIAGVRPGTYNLFAYLQGNDGPAGGAYTQYVKCGLQASCSDHTPIAVTVGAGETVRDIDVADWYAPVGTFPPRPR
jgi:hypothetical protein